MAQVTKQKLLDNLYVKYQVALLDQDIEDKIIRGDGQIQSKVALVGEAPGDKEEKFGKPFVGSAGKNLDKFLSTIKVNRRDVYVTNVVKFRPKGVSPKTGKPINRTPTKSEVDLCAPFLFEELKIIEPSIVITLGNVALKAITGDGSIKIGDFHGRLLELSGLLIFPLYHPASVIYNQQLNDTYECDLRKLSLVLGNMKK